MTEPLLTMTGIAKRFGPTHALRGVDLQAAPGRVHSLIGENGAGKSTLMKVLAGAITPDAGKMVLDREVYRPGSPSEARRSGVAMIYQELNLAPELSVEDNIMLGQERGRFGLLNRRQQREAVREALDFLGHVELRPEAIVAGLSIGARQLVEIARALVQRSRVIVFDEPTSSLGRADVENLFRVIRTLRKRGLAIVYISHFLEEVREICDDYTVLRDGESVGSGGLTGASDADIVSLMVGRTVDELFPRVPHTPSDVLLRAENLTASPMPTDVTLELKRGEIFGLAGLIGAGRSELVRCLFGLEPIRAGSVTVAESAPKPNPAARIRAGLGFVSEDRKTEGLAQELSIADNLTLSRLEPYRSWGLLSLKQRRERTHYWMNELSVKARSSEQPVAQLSGGNQQKVAIARVMHQEADLFLLDEPTRGIDVGTKAEIYRLMGELAARQRSVLFVSSYLTELLAVCDRIGVMSRGRLREIRPASEWTEESIMSVAVAT